MYFKIFKIGRIYAFLKVTWDKLWLGIRPLTELFLRASGGGEESHQERVYSPQHSGCVLFKFKTHIAALETCFSLL